MPGLGAYLHVLFQQWLIDKGVDFKKVQFVEVSFPQMPDVLRAGSVDAVVSGDPGAGSIQQSKVGYMVANYLAEMPDGVPAIVYATTRDWAAKHPAEVKAFRAALAEAVEYGQKNPQDAKRIAAAFIKMPAAVMEALRLPKLRTEIGTSDIQYWIDMMTRQSLLTTKLSASNILAP